MGQVPAEENATAEFSFDGAGNLKTGYKLKDGYKLQNGCILEVTYRNASKSEMLFAEINKIDDREKVLSVVEKISDATDIKNVPAENFFVESKAEKLLDIDKDEMPQFKIFPALGTAEAREIQKARGVKVNPNDIAAPTGKTGVAFGLLKCRDSGNVKITHIMPTANRTPFQFYIGRNKKRKFITVINKNTKLDVWYKFIDAGNNFDILYSDLPEAVSNKMDVQKAKRINVTLETLDPESSVFIRAVKSNVIEYAVAKTVEELATNNKEPVPIVLK